MRAIGVRTYGGPEQLEEVDLPDEPLGPGQVRIRVTAAAVSPTDTLLRSGARAEGDTAPDVADVPGMDVAGTVVELGPDTVADLAPGDRVIGIVVPSGQHGAYREDLVLPLGSVVAAPAVASDAEAATLPMNGLTARYALHLLGLTPGQVLAVTGAAGTLGAYVIQLAKADGLVVVADAKPGDDADLVRAFGADHVVERGDDVAQRVRALFPDGVDGLVDGSVQGPAVLDAVRDGGGVATVRGWDGSDTPGAERVRVVPVWVREAAEQREWLAELRDQAQTGVLTLRVADVLPAAEAPEAHRRLEAGGLRGRVVLDLTR